MTNQTFKWTKILPMNLFDLRSALDETGVLPAQYSMDAELRLLAKITNFLCDFNFFFSLFLI